MNVFDIIVLVLISYGAYEGYKRGLISGLVKLLGNIFGLIVAAKEYMQVYSWLDQNTSLRDWVRPFIYKMMLPSVESRTMESQQNTLEGMLSLFPQEVRELLKNNLITKFQSYSQYVVEEITHTLANTLTDNFLKLLSFLLLYMLIVVIVSVVTSTILSPLGLFSGFVNRGGGFIFGALSSFVFLAILIGLLSPATSLVVQEPLLNFLQEGKTYPILVETYTSLVELLRLNLEQGLTIPFHFDNINIPDKIKIPSDFKAPNLQSL